MIPLSDYMVALGDSQVTDTATEVAYPFFLAMKFYDPKLGYIKMGMPGASSTQIADAYLAAQPAYRTFDLLIDAGVNNYNGTTQQENIILADLDRIVQACRSGRFRIQEILPRADRSTDTAPLRGLLAAFNDRLQSIYGPRFIRRLPGLQAAKTSAPADITAASSNLVPPSLLKPSDPIHRNQAGHRVEAEIAAQSIRGGW